MSDEVIQKRLSLSDDLLNAQMKSGSSRYENQVQWARFYLSKAGYIDSSRRGVWSLTEKGITANITEKKADEIFQEVRREYNTKKTMPGELDIDEENSAPTEMAISAHSDHRSELLEIIRNLSPDGFESLCQRLLREAGFQNVIVTGRTGDGGIDGKGILQINSLVSMQVVFQSKRYKADSLVTTSQVRDLRGAMEGRAEKGILITTSNFTADARKEAVREGAKPIELVDGDKLVAMFEELELGLIPRKAYEVDRNFFEEFSQKRK